jgi:hypothetical protein
MIFTLLRKIVIILAIRTFGTRNVAINQISFVLSALAKHITNSVQQEMSYLYLEYKFLQRAAFVVTK